MDIMFRNIAINVFIFHIISTCNVFSETKILLDYPEYHIEANDSISTQSCLFRNNKKIKCFYADEIILGQSIELKDYLLVPIQFSSGGAGFSQGWSSLIIDDKKSYKIQDYKEYITSSNIIDNEANQAKIILSDFNSGDFIPNKIVVFNKGIIAVKNIDKSWQDNISLLDDCDRLKMIKENCALIKTDKCNISKIRNLISRSDSEFLKYSNLFFDSKKIDDFLMSCSNKCSGDYSLINLEFDRKFCPK